MKLKRMISALLVLCMVLPLTACMSAGTNPTESQTTPTTTVPVTTTTAPPPTTTAPGPKTLHIEDYVTGIDTSKINDDTIINLLHQAEAILQEYDVVIIEDSYEIKHFVLRSSAAEDVVILDRKQSGATDPDCLVTIYTSAITEEKHDDIRYMLMGALLLQEYQNCYYNPDHNFFESWSNSHYQGRIYIIPTFEESGYDTMEELYDATRFKEYSVGEAGAYLIWFTGVSANKWLYPIWTPEFYAMDNNDMNQYYTNLLAEAFPEE